MVDLPQHIELEYFEYWKSATCTLNGRKVIWSIYKTWPWRVRLNGINIRKREIRAKYHVFETIRVENQMSLLKNYRETFWLHVVI